MRTARLASGLGRSMPGSDCEHPGRMFRTPDSLAAAQATRITVAVPLYPRASALAPVAYRRSALTAALPLPLLEGLLDERPGSFCREHGNVG